ncbi:DUF4253 domain-containing protein [Micromonospora psammae]|uniref:DUF4253 domain-containing protein n=1 Tax=Micromonospora sp. CPCC 205556 TaxID=3122398 RepID=UPI002FF2A663
MSWTRQLPADLPEGRLITPTAGDRPRYWLSTAPARPGQWARRRADHRQTGLWPLLTVPDTGLADPSSLFMDDHPGISSPDDHDAATVLSRWWHQLLPEEDEDDSSRRRFLDPVGTAWPGTAPPQVHHDPADEIADWFAQQLRDDETRLALVPAPTGADTLTALAWTGPVNHDNDTARFTAVLRDWQSRFGARVVALGPATLYVSVAAPPITTEDTLLVAAEHLAFCPDNVWQGNHSTLGEYAEALLGTRGWAFWWD